MSERRVTHMTLLCFASAESDDLRFMANELLARRKDDEDAARSLDIDPPEPGSPLARAFVANDRLRKERNAAYEKGRMAAKAEALEALDKVRAALSGEPCKCGGQGKGFNGFHYAYAPGCRL